MNPLISICIPTCERPRMLAEALRSCIEQRYRPLEILVGDDSRSDDSAAVVERLRGEFDGRLVYLRNTPALKQARNVNRLFEHAAGDRLLLLHDDDLLVPGALETLHRCFERDPRLSAAFGKQILIDDAGTRQPRPSTSLNESYFRSARYAGSVLTPLESALVQQFPNNGYLVRSELARRTRYRDERELGTTRWCDFEFSLRLARNARRYEFVDAFTAAYRLSADSVSRRGHPTYMYPLIRSLPLPASCEWARAQALRRLAPVVVSNHAHKGEVKEALRIFFSSHYPRRRRFSRHGLYQLGLIARGGRAPSP